MWSIDSTTVLHKKKKEVNCEVVILWSMWGHSQQRLLHQTVSDVLIHTNCHPNIFCTRRWVLCLCVQTVTATSASDSECCDYTYKLSPQRLLYQAVSDVPRCTNCHSNVFCTRRWMLCLNAQTVTLTSSVTDGECCAYMYKLSPQHLLYQMVSAVPICTNCHNQRLLYQTVSAVPVCTNCQPNIFCTRR